jgi:hypothetical protein
MTEKFTRGEWVILPISRSTADVPAFLVHERKFGEVAIVNFHGGSDGETEKANAALIAAAPDMYRVLKFVKGALGHGSLVMEIDKVLQKARGEE